MSSACLLTFIISPANKWRFAWPARLRTRACYTNAITTASQLWLVLPPESPCVDAAVWMECTCAYVTVRKCLTKKMCDSQSWKRPTFKYLGMWHGWVTYEPVPRMASAFLPNCSWRRNLAIAFRCSLMARICKSRCFCSGVMTFSSPLTDTRAPLLRS